MFEMCIASGEDGPTAVVRVFGEVDLVSAPELHEEIVNASGTSAAQVVVDMTAVQFIDAAGIGALVGAAEVVQRQGGNLLLRRPSPAVSRLLEVLILDGALPIEDGTGEHT